MLMNIKNITILMSLIKIRKDQLLKYPKRRNSHVSIQNLLHASVVVSCMECHPNIRTEKIKYEKN